MHARDIERGVTEQPHFHALLSYAVASAAQAMRESHEKLHILPTNTAYRQTAGQHYHHCPEVFI